jgi:hypothetical protein
MRADDAFWAARLVARFPDETIRAIVAKARYSEPGAADHIVSTLIARRDKVLRAWLTPINPLAEAQLSADGILTFENAAIAAGAAPLGAAYTLTWSRVDNATGATIGGSLETRAAVERTAAPDAVLAGSQFVRVAVRTLHPDFPEWEAPVTFTFRRTGGGWDLVGVERTVPPRDRR